MWLIVLPLIFKLSPPVVLREILAVRGGTKPLLFLEVPTFVTSRLLGDPSSQKWNYVGEKMADKFYLKCPTST
jgi:hypothetical protein